MDTAAHQPRSDTHTIRKYQELYNSVLNMSTWWHCIIKETFTACFVCKPMISLFQMSICWTVKGSMCTGWCEYCSNDNCIVLFVKLVSGLNSLGVAYSFNHQYDDDD